MFLYFDITDKGPDQACRQRRTASSIASAGKRNVIYVPGNCFMHMYHACVKDGLHLADELLNQCFSSNVLKNFRKYFASVSKLVHVWRERQQKSWQCGTIIFGTPTSTSKSLAAATHSGSWGAGGGRSKLPRTFCWFAREREWCPRSLKFSADT